MGKVIKWVLPVIQAAVSVVLLFTLKSSGLLPGKYLGMAAAVVAVLLLFTVLLTQSRFGAVRSLGTILAIFVCGMLAFGMVYVNQITRTLDSIAGSDTEVKSIAVLVRKDNAANSIEETKGIALACSKGLTASRSVKRSKT